MKKIIVIMVVFLTSIGYVMAGENEEINDTLTISGNIDNSGNGYIYCYLKNHKNEYMGFQMLINLPDGISMVKDDDDEYIIEYGERFNSLSDKARSRFGLQMAKTSKGYQIVCLNTAGKSIEGVEGELMRIPIKSTTNSPTNQYVAHVSEIEFTTIDANAERPYFAEFDFIINSDKGTDIDITEVNELFNNRNMDNSGKFYNLNGQQIERPRKGLLVQKGKKIIVK